MLDHKPKFLEARQDQSQVRQHETSNSCMNRHDLQLAQHDTQLTPNDPSPSQPESLIVNYNQN